MTGDAVFEHDYFRCQRCGLEVVVDQQIVGLRLMDSCDTDPAQTACPVLQYGAAPDVSRADPMPEQRTPLLNR